MLAATGELPCRPNARRWGGSGSSWGLVVRVGEAAAEGLMGVTIAGDDVALRATPAGTGLPTVWKPLEGEAMLEW